MVDEWVQKSLGDLIDIKHGFAFEGKYFRDEPPGDVLLTPGNFAVGGGFKADKFRYYDGPVPEEFVLQGGDLLITMTDLSKNADTLGFPAQVPDTSGKRRYLHNQRLGKVLPKKESLIDLRYLHYLLCSQPYRAEIVASATGTTVKHTSPERIKRFRFLLPPVSEQRGIGHILGTLDDKIELNRRMNETLEVIARAIFKSWFVDFDPVRARVSGEAAETISRGLRLPRELLALFPNRFQGSELGEIPDGWEVNTLGKLCERVSMGPFGSDIKTNNFVVEGVPIIRGSNLTDGFIDENFAFLTEAKADELRNANAQSGDIVITHRGTLGQVGLIPTSSRYPRYVVSQSQMVLTPRKERATSRFIYEFLRSPIGQHALLANTSQVGVPAIARPTTSVKAINLVSPPARLLRAYDSVVDPLLDRALNTLRESITLTAMRDALIPNLLSGELRVPLEPPNGRS